MYRTALLLVSAALTASAPAQAADYPDKPIRLIAPIAAGTSALDTAARLIAERMGPKLGGQVIVINQPGASGTLAAGAIAKGPKDGYTFNLNTAAAVGYPRILNKDLPYDPAREITTVALMGSVPVGLFVNVASDIKTLPDLVAAGKARPDTINYASPGIGTVSHIAVEMFSNRTEARFHHVPYGASLAYWNDLMGGTIQLVSGGLTGGLPLVKDGRLRLIGVLGKSRSAIAPDAPAFGETMAGFDVPSWLGLVIAAGTPDPIVDKLEAAAMASFAETSFKSALLQAGIDVNPMGRKAFANMLATELPVWERALRTAGQTAPGK